MKYLNIELYHGEQQSWLSYNGQCISYTRKIHQFESESDYKLLVSEFSTYSWEAFDQLWDYLKSKRNQ